MRTEPELLNERLDRLALVLDEIMPNCANLVRDALDLLKEQDAMNVDVFVQWCIDSHIMGDATVRGIKYWVEKYKEIKKGR